jgi:hypothetical protein
MREERRLKVLGNRVLRKIFRPKRNEVTGEWRRLHNEGLHVLYLLITKYYSDDQIEKNEMGGACGIYEGEKRCLQGVIGEA